MIKELSLAIIFGLLIGFGLTGTFYFVRQQNKNSANSTPNIIVPTSTPDTSTNSKTTPTPASTSDFNLEIVSPQNNDIISTSKTTIKGLSAPNSLVIITTPVKNYHLTADTQGNFSQIIDLEPGINAITLTAINQNDQESHTEISLTYSTTKLE